PLYFVGVQGNRRIAPAEGDVGVMTFGFRQFADVLDEAERFPEIAETKGPFDAVGIVTQLPLRGLRLKASGFIARERRDAAPARRDVSAPPPPSAPQARPATPCCRRRRRRATPRPHPWPRPPGDRAPRRRH